MRSKPRLRSAELLDLAPEGLALLAAGFAAYALWRVLQAIYGDKWAKRIGYLGRAAIYFGLAYSAARILAGAGGGESQNEKAHKTTAVVLSWPAGQWLVGAAALVAIGVGTVLRRRRRDQSIA